MGQVYDIAHTLTIDLSAHFPLIFAEDKIHFGNRVRHGEVSAEKNATLLIWKAERCLVHPIQPSFCGG